MMPSDERDEESVICQQLDLVLGGEVVTVPVRSIRENRVLRRRIGSLLSALSPTEAASPAAALAAMWPRLLEDGADILMDLPALYAPEIAEQCKRATDAELLAASEQIWRVVFPFVEALLSVLGTVKVGQTGQ
jgi:hypothetical protein